MRYSVHSVFEKFEFDTGGGADAIPFIIITVIYAGTGKHNNEQTIKYINPIRRNVWIVLIVLRVGWSLNAWNKVQYTLCESFTFC